MFSSEYCEIFNSTFLTEHPRKTGSILSPLNELVLKSSIGFNPIWDFVCIFFINPFLPNFPFWPPLKTLENLWFSNFFQGDQKGTPGRKGLIMSLMQQWILWISSQTKMLAHLISHHLCQTSEILVLN